MHLQERALWGSRSKTIASALTAATITAAGTLPAIEIQLDYRFDTNGYFNVAERKAALEKSASIFEEILTDNLLRIDPADFSSASWSARVRNPQTGLTEVLPGLIVPEDTVIVFVGARQLGGNVRGQAGPSGWSASGFSSWFSRIRARGNPGADFSSENSSLATDFAPFAGFISFDDDTSFNYSTTQNLSGTDFVSVAIHEFCHVFGIGTAASWDNLISGSSFTGPASTRAAGGNPGIDSGLGHFAQSVSDEPAFGFLTTAHGASSPVIMRPSLSSNGGRLTVLSDLDVAGLADIGWEVVPQLRPGLLGVPPSSFGLTWSSSSHRDYTVERSSSLDFSSASQFPVGGDGSVKSWTDPSPPPARAFYRIVDEPYLPGGSSSSLIFAANPQQATSVEVIIHDSVEPRWVDHCGCDGH